jgi:uncharacterized protein
MRWTHRVERAVTVAAVAILGVLVMLIALAWWAQERIAYQPPRERVAAPAGVERAEYRAADGQALFALTVRSTARAGTIAPRVLLAFHGNADLAAWLVPWADEVARRTGYAVVLAEYRGYGGLDGHPTAPGLRLDARAASDLVRERFGDRVPVALYGHSLGSAVASELAVERAPTLLMLESPFTSALDIASTFLTPMLRWVWPLIGRIPYDTERRVAELRAPVWVAHGDRDFVIPVWMGRAVFAAAKHPGALLIVPGGPHNGLSDVGGEAYWRWLERALH